MEVESLGVTEALEIPELRRNSTICVTIDDVAEGLLVVSFSHNDNLYQGILFQLNRERGIPSGISFPKEPPLGTSPKAEDVLVAVPLHQRHSYNSGLNGPYYTQVSQPSLRRIIKPPARFKNARMSLRLRARPVLCAKCRTLCDEKSDSGSDLPKEDNGKGQTDKSKKDRPKPKNENVAGYLNGTHNGNEQTSSSTASIAIDPQDLNYESVGSTRVVENYWKRPLVKPLIPLTEETYSKLRKQKGNIAPKNKRKRATTLPFIGDTKTDSISTPENEAVPGNEDLPPLLPPCDIIPNTRQRLKRLSLTKCITKLTEMRTEACAKRTRRSVGEDKPPKLDLIDSSSEDHHRSTGESLTAPVSEQDRISIRPKRKSSGYGRKGSQSWGSRIRTKSKVPLRYREEGYLTKNIFNFNKRQSPTQASDLPVLTICRNENANSFTVSKAPDLLDESGAEIKSEKAEMEPIYEGTVLSSLPPKEDVTPVESVDLTEPIRMKPNFTKPPEVTKTPTIKITFGTSGNGMVVQIPPKLTQNAECDSTDLKAVRKALKRAKKEAKRKRSISPAVPSSDALSPVEPSVKMEKLEEMTTPISENLKTEIYPDPIQMENGSLEMTPPEVQLNEVESESFPRKKKKQKKHRRSSKLLKENEREVSPQNFPSQDLNESNSSSSSSSLTQDCLPQESCASQKEVTMKIFDSVSSPATPEPSPKDSCPLRLRRKSVPATLSPSVDLPKRVCINLKRIDANEYVPLPSRSNTPDEEEKVLENNENNGVDTEDHSDECLPDGHSDEGVMRAFTESVQCYEDKETGCIYHKGDVIWGKLPACPWWPGKITDILLCGSEEVRAIISWFKSTTQSSIRITMILPFIEYYDSKYSRNRRRGSYQLAVNAAKLEVLNSASHNEPTQPNRDLN